MDSKEICLKIEQATKSLIPLSVTAVKMEARIATIRIVAEAFSSMSIPARIKAVFACLDSYDRSLAQTIDFAFELLSPAEDQRWNQENGTTRANGSGSDEMAAKDLTP